MNNINYGQLEVGKKFWKDGVEYEKTDPIRSGGCGCAIVGNARDVQTQGPRLFSDGEEVQVEQ